jgi:hypothetical protein
LCSAPCAGPRLSLSLLAPTPGACALRPCLCVLVLTRAAYGHVDAWQATDQQIAAVAADRARVLPLYDNLFLCIKIFFSLSTLDIPQYFLDHMPIFMGLFAKYLSFTSEPLAAEVRTHTQTHWERGGAISAPPLWRDVRVHWHCVCVLVCRSLAFTCGDPPSTQSGDDEAGAGRLERVRAAVVEVVSLYAARYHVDFPMLPAFIEAIWNLLGRTSLAGKNDLVRTGTHAQTDRQTECVSDPHADSTQIPKHKHV